MRVELREVEFAGKQEDYGATRSDSAVAETSLRIRRQGHVVIDTDAGGLVDGQCSDGGEGNSRDRRLHVVRKGDHRPMRVQLAQVRHARESHLLTKRPYQGLGRQREAGRPADLLRLHLTYRAAWQLHERHADLQ